MSIERIPVVHNGSSTLPCTDTNINASVVTGFERATVVYNSDRRGNPMQRSSNPGFPHTESYIKVDTKSLSRTCSVVVHVNAISQADWPPQCGFAMLLKQRLPSLLACRF